VITEVIEVADFPVVMAVATIAGRQKPSSASVAAAARRETLGVLKLL
jgi:hypothetical protein